MKIPFATAALCAAFASLTATRAASFSTYQAADVVLGQPDFTSTGSGIQQNRFNGPGGVAVDPISGKVFVADSDNHRVLRFSSTAAATNGANPEAVLGQQNFTDHSANQGGTVDADTLDTPADVCVDAGGRLWVADYKNSRVLRFDAAASIANGADASGVLGQTLFTTNTAGTSVTKLKNPIGLTVDANGVLWVAEQGNHRVLRFDAAALRPNGTNANVVLGQPNFTTSTPATSASGMASPAGVTTDSSGRLWVADSANNRVLRFEAAATKDNGANADGVLGQSDFVTSTSATSSMKMAQPFGVHADSAGNLWVGDYINRRALRFDNAASLPDGAPASLVLGQPDFTTKTFATTAQGGGGLSHIAGGPGGSLLVADYDNSRVLRYSPIPVPSPTVKISGKKKLVTTKVKVVLKGTTTGSVTSVAVKIGKKTVKAVGTASWSAKVKLQPGKNKITITASGPGGTSAPAKVTVIRQ